MGFYPKGYGIWGEFKLVILRSTPLGECIELARRGGKKQRRENLGHHLVAI